MFDLKFLRPKNLVLGLATLIASACADTVTSPSGEYQVANKSASTKPRPPMQQRAMIDANGVTTLSVTSGSFAYFDANMNDFVPGAPALGALVHVHVKFCKNTYKDYGLHQFTANFHDRAAKSWIADAEAPSTPQYPDNLTHKQVNWDRSEASNILFGQGSANFKFTGIPADASLEVHYNVRMPDGKQYSIKTCTPVLPAPDLSVETVSWPTGAAAGVSTIFESAVNLAVFSSIPGTASCAIYENGLLLGKSLLVNAGQMCAVPLTFTQGGVHNLTVKLEDIGPADSNPNNNSATGTVIIRGGTPPTGGGEDPTTGPVIEMKVQTPKNILQLVDSTFVWTNGTRTASELQQQQGAPLIVIFPNMSFTGPTQIIVSASTDGTVLMNETTISGTGPCLNAASPTSSLSYSVSLCNDEGSSAATLMYTVNAAMTNTGYVHGSFKNYGPSITFNVSIINGGYKYTIPASTLTASMKFDYASPCGSGKEVQEACRLDGIYHWRAEGNGWLLPAAYVTGVPYTP